MTARGGKFGRGTIFRLTLNGEFSLIYSFGENQSDGAVPTGRVVFDAEGTLYGTTKVGGTNHCFQIPTDGPNCGTVFKLTKAGRFTTIYNFGQSASDGVAPNGLVLASDGKLYGTTESGGANTCSLYSVTNTCGTVFRMTKSGAITVLHSFSSGAIAPQGPVLEGLDGWLYGTTVSGGAGNCGSQFGCGTVYRIRKSGSDFTVLHDFALAGLEDGFGPGPYLAQATDGTLYGITSSGGDYGVSLAGTVFRLTTKGVKTTLYSFRPPALPHNPIGGVVIGPNDTLYGTTFYNGDYGGVGARGGAGTFYRLRI